jgi:hypothetical protein
MSRGSLSTTVRERKRHPLDDWLASAIAPGLRRRGFAGGPRSYWRASGDFYSTIQFQGSAANQPDWARFVINYGVRHDGVARVLGVPGPSAKTFAGSHIGLRVAANEGGDWWVISDGEPPRSLVVSVERALSDRVLPSLGELATADGFRRCFEGHPEFGQYGSMFLDALDQLERGG